MKLSPDLRLLIDRRTGRRLLIALVGAVVVAGAEIVALASVVPLMSLLSGATPSLGPLTQPGGWLYGWPSRNLAVLLAAVIFGAFLFKGLFSIGYRWWVGGFVAETQITTARRLLEYYLSAPYPLHLRRSLGDFTRRLNDAVAQVYNGVVMGVVNILTETITTVAVLATLLVIAPAASLAMTAFFAIFGTLLYLVVRRGAQRAGERGLAAAEEIFSNSVQPLQNIRDVKIRSNQEVFLRLYETSRRESAMAARISAFIQDLPKYTLEVLFILGVAVVTGVLFWVGPPDQALGTLALIALAGFRLLPSLTRLMATLNGVKASLPALDLLLEELREADGVRARRGPDSPPRPLQEKLEIQNLHFSYATSDGPVLRNINLTVPRGSSIALVGGSGAGKTTLADCIIGLLPPDSGRILVDGVDISTDMHGWQQTLGMVPQNVLALVGSAVDNISFRDPNPDIERVRSAADQAQLTEMIEALPDGFGSFIGPGGAGLSGGQRQRLGLARALYREPSFLILDEATSALDNATERQVTDAISALQGQVTILVIAHRLSTVRQCDQIAFMENGSVTDIGTFDELRDRNPEFAYLVALGNLDQPLDGEELDRIRFGDVDPIGRLEKNDTEEDSQLA